MFRRDWEKLLDAALDQPHPTPELQAAVNHVLQMTHLNPSRKRSKTVVQVTARLPDGRSYSWKTDASGKRTRVIVKTPSFKTVFPG